MGKINWRTPLQAGFTALALTLPFAPPSLHASVSPTFNTQALPSAPLDAMKELFEAHRGLVLGDLHTDLALPLWLAEQMPALKAAGVNTLYVEVPIDRQPLLDDMAKGSTKAKQQLVQYFLEKSPGMAQSRVELMHAAQKAGLRVLALDVAFSEVAELAKTDEHYIAKRLLWSDPKAESQFRQLDDGQKFIIFFGAAHTYPANSSALAKQHSKGINNAAGCLVPDNFFETANVTPEGGLDTRLGIPSIDSGNCPSEHYTGTALIRKSTGQANDYIIKLPTHPLQGIGFPAADYNNWRTILARDAGSLYHAAYSGPPGAIPAAEAALAILEFRDALKQDLNPKLLAQQARSAHNKLDVLGTTDAISPIHLNVLRRHVIDMLDVATRLQPQGIIAQRLSTSADSPTALLGMGAAARPPSEEQVELTRSRIRAQLEDMQPRQRAEAPKLLN